MEGHLDRGNHANIEHLDDRILLEKVVNVRSKCYMVRSRTFKMRVAISRP